MNSNANREQNTWIMNVPEKNDGLLTYLFVRLSELSEIGLVQSNCSVQKPYHPKLWLILFVFLMCGLFTVLIP